MDSDEDEEDEVSNAGDFESENDYSGDELSEEQKHREQAAFAYIQRQVVINHWALAARWESMNTEAEMLAEEPFEF